MKLKFELEWMKGGSDAILSTMDNIIVIDEMMMMMMMSFVMVVVVVSDSWEVCQHHGISL